MASVEWIKIKVEMFDHQKIRFIRKNIPEGNDICLIWVMLLCLAGKTNNCGQLLLTDDIPYNEEMLSNEFDFPVNTIRLAIETFRKLDMVELVDKTISITGWYEHQSGDKLDKIQQQNRDRQKRFKEKQKLIGNVKGNVKVTSSCSYSYSNSYNTNTNKDNIYIIKEKIKERFEELNYKCSNAIYDFSKDHIYVDAINNYGLELIINAIEWWTIGKEYHPLWVKGYEIDFNKLISSYQFQKSIQESDKDKSKPDSRITNLEKTVSELATDPDRFGEFLEAKKELSKLRKELA